MEAAVPSILISAELVLLHLMLFCPSGLPTRICLPPRGHVPGWAALIKGNQQLLRSQSARLKDWPLLLGSRGMVNPSSRVKLHPSI